LLEKDELLNEQEELLTEKEWLLKEIHHRVKNNLQIVMSLLYTQGAYLQSTDAKEAIRDSQNRVQVISIIHQKLYSKSNVSFIVVADYVGDLVRHLGKAYDCSRRNITFTELLDPVKLDISQAVPMGLILNEAITNCIKYAFEKEGGEIIINGHSIPDDSFLLTIADNGKGLPGGFNMAECTSLGMEMMRALSKQLGGTVQVEDHSGVTVVLRFKIFHSFKP
jgi:two-component sensor histidine kinase